VIQRRQERDVGFILPLVSDLTESQYQLFVLFQSVTVKHAESAVPALLDSDVADGAAAAAATLETAGKGIIYEHQATSVPAQRLSSELGNVLAELASKAGSQRGRLERDAATALRRLERGARTAAKTLEGDETPVYLKLLGRILDRGARNAEAEPGQSAPASKLIVPP
jgi:hypothetical protein